MCSFFGVSYKSILLFKYICGVRENKENVMMIMHRGNKRLWSRGKLSLSNP